MRGLFVTGTDTGAGKSVLSACLVAALRAAGVAAGAHKPVLTGTEEPPGPWPRDDELLAAVSGAESGEVAPLRFGPPVSPHLAAQLAGTPIEAATLLEGVRRASAVHPEMLVVEGVGGLTVPLNDTYLVCDLAADLGMPLLIAARPGLGTINHTLLTLRTARACGLDVRAVVITPWPERPSRLERSNLETIRRFGFVEVDTLARATGPDLDELARVGGALPWRRWLGERRAVRQPA
jgi:dethiobiotin synthetase